MKNEIVKEELIAAAEMSQKIVRLVMAECDSVGRGLLAGAFAYAILARSSPMEVPQNDLHEIFDMVYRMVQEAEGEARVLQ